MDGGGDKGRSLQRVSAVGGGNATSPKQIVLAS